MKRYLPVAILAGAVVALQLLTLLFGVTYWLTQLTMSAYYTLLCLGLCMLMGYAGQISLGQAGFFAIGGYISARLTTIDLSASASSGFVRFLGAFGAVTRDTNIYGTEFLHIAPWVAFLLAVLFTIFVAALIGIPVLRLKGHYLAMATLGFGIIVQKFLLGVPFLGMADGINDVPAFRMFAGLSLDGSISHRIMNYYIAWFVVVAGLALLVNLIGSRAGRALKSLHGSEAAASAMGVDVSSYKLKIFVLSAVFASIAGVMMTHYNAGIGPGEAGVIKSVRYLAIVAVGGMANLWGTLVMSVVLNFLSLRGVFGSYDNAVFGLVLILVMIFAPQGLLRVSLWQTAVSKIKGLAAKSMGKRKSEGGDA